MLLARKVLPVLPVQKATREMPVLQALPEPPVHKVLLVLLVLPEQLAQLV